jgi:Short C-terminal domain
MRYVLRTLFGFGLIAFAVVGISYSVYQLLQVGTCASGGPYVSARQCPTGTEWLGLSIFGYVVVLLGGAGIYAGRGTAPGSDRPASNMLLVVWVWTGIFWGIATACFLGVWGPEANPGPGGKEGGLIVGFLFVPLGALAFLALNVPWRGRRPEAAGAGTALPGSARVAKAAVKRVPGLDPLARLERLERLRQDGVVTQSEFEKLKAEILSR